MRNLRKNQEMKSIWFKKREYQKLINALEGNFHEEVLNIIYEIWKRGDL